MAQPTILEQFGTRFDIDDGCWIWRGYLTEYGYGILRYRGERTTAHRMIYQILHGRVSKGYDIDHLCKNRACVNPDHLEMVTHKENVLRGDTIARSSASKTECPKGHEYSGDNLYFDKIGKRRCRACSRESQMLYRRELNLNLI